jgi:hypothetical protein
MEGRYIKTLLNPVREAGGFKRSKRQDVVKL